MQKEEQDKECLDSLTCPSFNCYFTDQQQLANRTQNDVVLCASQKDDADFEFTAFRDELGFTDDVVFPLFDRDRRNRVSGGEVLRFPVTGQEIRRSQRDSLPAQSSESSSEEDEVERVPTAAYSVWRPNSPQAGKCRKSNSTGSSSGKKWKLLDFLRRSNSEGKESLMLLAPAPEKKKVNARWSIDGTEKLKSFTGEKKAAVAVSAHEALYVRNRELRRSDKKKSFLPYKPNLVGFCTSRFGKAFSSF